MTTQQALVTDTNGRLRGVMDLPVEFHQGVACRVTHGDQTYWATGKEGTHAATGQPTLEMATENDARLWITLDGSDVWED